jgi:DNA-binding PadR family transcriptional regulator
MLRTYRPHAIQSSLIDGSNARVPRFALTQMASDAVQYALLGIIASRGDGTHGYQLKTDFEWLYGGFWSLNYGQLYRTLDRLERGGFIEGSQVVQCGRPNRKVYRITSNGKKLLEDWLPLPPNDDARPLRDELAVKLLFLGNERRDEVLALVRGQRALYLKHLARLTKHRTRLGKAGRQSVAVSLLLVQADMRVRADLAWLDLVEQQLTSEPAR